MDRAHLFGAIVWIATLNPGCGDDAAANAPIATAGSAAPTSGTSSTPAAGAGSAAVSGMTGASGSASTTAGTSSSGAAGMTGAAASGTAGHDTPVGEGGTSAAAAGRGGTDASAGTGTSVAAAGMNGGTTAGAGSGAANAAGAGAAGDDAMMEIPPPVTEPVIWGYALGASDIAAATKFYTDVMKMMVLKDAVKRDDRTDTLLYSTQAMRGGRLVLMKFDDMRETRKISAKLVWQAQSVSEVNRAASTYPDYVSRLNIGIVQFDGPDTYIQEVGSSFDTTAGASAISVPYPIALGFAVSDQQASIDFYTALGMTASSIGTFTVTDATGTGSITEFTVKYPTGPGVVLQQWTPMRNAKDNPVGVILMVPDAKALADRVVAAGGTIVKQAERSPLYDNRRLVVAKDLDGYLLDIVE
jgi:catechol 2,3-dioxygenase-like lactoylglutathione lyase family enzyme